MGESDQVREDQAGVSARRPDRLVCTGKAAALREGYCNVGTSLCFLRPHPVRRGYCRCGSVGFAQWGKNAQSAWCNQHRGRHLEVGARAGDFIFVAGMQGVDPATNKLVEGDEARIRQAFLNLKLIAQSEGATLQDCVRITVYVSDLHRFAPLVSKVQAELWGKPPYPPRTMLEVQRLFDDDIVEIDSVFYAPTKK